jgi:hypothetical protein
MVLGTAIVVDLPRDVTDVLVSSPDTVNAAIRSPRRAYLTALTIGQANVFFFDEQGRQIDAFDISVRANKPPAPYIGPSEPEIKVTVYRGPNGGQTPMICSPTNCVVPSRSLKVTDVKEDMDLNIVVESKTK